MQYETDKHKIHTYKHKWIYVTVTEALVLRPLLEDRGHITESSHILVPTNRIKQECFQSRQNESIDRSSFSSIGSLFHARGAATEKALSSIRRHVRSMMRLPLDKARSVDQLGILATDVSRSEMYSGVKCTVHSEMGPVRQNPIQRTVRTAHLSVLM